MSYFISRSVLAFQAIVSHYSYGHALVDGGAVLWVDFVD
jgi:hypothetical protein